MDKTLELMLKEFHKVEGTDKTKILLDTLLSTKFFGDKASYEVDTLEDKEGDIHRLIFRGDGGNDAFTTYMEDELFWFSVFGTLSSMMDYGTPELGDFFLASAILGETRLESLVGIINGVYYEYSKKKEGSVENKETNAT